MKIIPALIIGLTSYGVCAQNLYINGGTSSILSNSSTFLEFKTSWYQGLLRLLLGSIDNTPLAKQPPGF